MHPSLLSEEFKQAVALRFEPGELIDFLQISMTEIIDLFEWEIHDRYVDVLKELRNEFD